MPTEIAAPRQSGLLSKVEIEEELDKFIAWPGADHGSVTTTSCKLFANHIQTLATEKVRAELERVNAERDAALAQYNSVKAKPDWATKDPFMVAEYLRENSVFNAELVIEMLEFAIEAAKQQAEVKP